MKKRICVLCAAVLAALVIVAGCASQAAAGGTAPAENTAQGNTASAPAPQAAVPASGKNKIVIYTSMYENVIESLKGTMAEKFPDCDIHFVYGGTGMLQSRIASQEAEGRLHCDILLVADPSYAIELKEKEMLHPYISSQAAELAFDYDKEGYWYPVRISNMVLVYNPARTPKNTIPASFEGFAHDARARGDVSMGSPHTSGTVLAALSAIRDKYGDGYFPALGRQQIQINMISGMAFDKLQSGEYKTLMMLEESALRKRLEDSANFEIIYPDDGTVMIPSPIMIIADKWSANHNTATAEAITEWFLGPDGQNAIVDGFMHSVRQNFPRLPQGSIPTSEIRAKSMPVDWEKTLRERDDLQYKFDEALAARYQR